MLDSPHSSGSIFAKYIFSNSQGVLSVVPSIHIHHFSDTYELAVAIVPPSTSSSTLVRFHDIYFAHRQLREFDALDSTWFHFLANSGIDIPSHVYSPEEHVEYIAELLMQQRLKLYKLPNMERLPQLPNGKGVAYRFVRGPKPVARTHTGWKALSIKDTAAAEALLADAKATEENLKGCIRKFDNLAELFSWDGSPITKRFTELLVKGDILAYKFPVTWSHAPSKPQGESVPATGPLYHPTYDTPPPARTSPAPKNVVPEKKPEPQSLAEASQRLNDAKPAVDAAKKAGTPLPGSSYSLADKQAVIESGTTERFLVRVIPSDKASDDGYIAQKRDHGGTIAWTAPLSMVEQGDTNAEALLNAFGTRYDPAKTYTVLIIDSHKMNEVANVQTIIPTNKNLQQLIADNPQITKVSPEVTQQVLNENFAPKYYTFAKGMNVAGVNQDKATNMENFAKDQGYSSEESVLLLKRHQLAKDVSAWEEFTGNGMTLDTNIKDKTVYGPVELVMLDKAPKTIGELKQQKAISLLSAS
jgi:hypothetical protein